MYSFALTNNASIGWRMFDGEELNMAMWKYDKVTDEFDVIGREERQVEILPHGIVKWWDGDYHCKVQIPTSITLEKIAIAVVDYYIQNGIVPNKPMLYDAMAIDPDNYEVYIEFNDDGI